MYAIYLITLFTLLLVVIFLTYRQLKKLHQNNYYLQLYFNKSLIPTIVINYHDKVLQLNNSFEKLFSETKESLNRTPWYQKILDDSSALQIRHALKGKIKNKEIVVTIITKDGTTQEYLCFIDKSVKKRIILSFISK